MLKLGPHVILSTPEALAFSRIAPVVKSLDNIEILKAALPSALRIFRHYFETQNLDDGAGAAREILISLGNYHHPKLVVEVWNECHPTTFQLKAAVDVLHAAGLKVAGASWGTGDYTPLDWRIAKDAGVDYISVHCYWGTQGFTQYHATRYRSMWQAGDPPVLITECGRDKIEKGNGGWLLDDVTARQFALELIAYDLETSKDSYVLAVTPFTWGPTPDWADRFNNDLLTGELLSALGHKGRPVITQSEFDRLVKNCFDRANIPYNPDSAFVKYFSSQLRQGRYLGAPEEPEHPSEDGSLLLQRFAGKYLWCRKDYLVQETALPFA